MKNIIRTLLILLATAGLSACSNEDDIEDIFVNRTWTLAFINEGSNRIAAKDNYYLQFYDKNFVVTTPSGAKIQGYWEADGENRSFRCTQVMTDGNISNDTIAGKMEKILEKAASYEGDINYLIIKQQDNVFMQFHNR